MRTAAHIIETVGKLVKKYDTRDPYELCKCLEIKIHFYNLEKKLKGFFFYQSRQKNIVIDSNVNDVLERILIDEATSMLDNETEEKIISILLDSFKDTTIILIAHRLSTVKNANTIYVLNNGTIMEHGNHDQLLEQKGIYYHLYNI